jgi:hypothetical protein
VRLAHREPAEDEQCAPGMRTPEHRWEYVPSVAADHHADQTRRALTAHGTQP